jgi:Amt family ammonium transporter
MMNLTATIRKPEARKYFAQYLGGKMIGIGLLCITMWAVVWYFGTQAGASMLHAPKLSGDDIVNPLNTAWVCVTAFLVFFMQAGFMMLEGGFARTREVSNVMMECIVDTALCGVLFYAFGFAFMFGEGNPWIGHQYFFLQGIPATYGTTGIGFLAFFLFQFAFADTASTIVSGAMVGRTDFRGDLVYSVFVSGFIYPIFGHWIWGPDGILGTGKFPGMVVPMRDFAGSTVVHTVGGVLAISGAIALGPRLGRKFKRDGGGLPPGHNMTLAALGGVILWFGWYGFNPGSTLSAMDFEGIGRVATNTTLAASTGALIAVAWVFARNRKWDVGISINGFLAGLVAITCPCYWVSPTGALVIGAVAGAVVVLAVDFTEWIRVDDPCGAFAVHGVAGIWGTLSLGLFATGDYGNPAYGAHGLFYGGGWEQLKSQMIGSLFVTVATLVVGLLVMFGVKALGILRISEDVEIEGLDIHEHGAPAYHNEPAYEGYSPIPTAKSSPRIVIPDEKGALVD